MTTYWIIHSQSDRDRLYMYEEKAVEDDLLHANKALKQKKQHNIVCEENYRITIINNKNVSVV